ncbi:hypothetical protein CISECK367B_23420 [Citrobacter sedlakii]|uniref:hypothetical protein n=1 Tax=Citrobacter sedlakii TaxID=67826 RepID=UPI001BA6F57E|nr:hypothetical protein [Citrobacter sedlakii]EKJ8217532.1 hypothetical protein [Citrobacter sedlakii]QUC29627.1 hypothetical protein JY391_19240 [Citrobacter sedlakii]
MKKWILHSVIFMSTIGIVGIAIHLINRNGIFIFDDQLKTCSSKLVIKYEKTTVDIEMTFILLNKENVGFIKIEGTEFTDEKFNSIVDRIVKFNYIKSEWNYIFTPTKIRRLKTETISSEMASIVFPVLFTTPYEEISYSLFPISDKGILFTHGNKPRFFCELI